MLSSGLGLIGISVSTRRRRTSPRCQNWVVDVAYRTTAIWQESGEDVADSGQPVSTETRPSRPVRLRFRRWLLPLIGLTGLTLGLSLLTLGIQMQGDRAQPDLLVVLNVVVGWSFLVSAIVALRKRPTNRVGLLLAGVGFVWFVSVLFFTDSDLAFSLSFVASDLFWAPVAHLLLAFPTGRLASRVDRVVVGLVYVWVLVGNSLRVLFLDFTSAGCQDCPRNVFMLRDDLYLLGVMSVVDAIVGVALAVSVVVMLVRRWRAASDPLRRVLRPVWWGLWPLFVAAAYFSVANLMAVPGDEFARPLIGLGFAVLPVSFLVGLLRTRLDRSLVGDLLIDLQAPMAHGRLRAALSEALGDPSLRLAFWLPQRGKYLDEEGKTLQLPTDRTEGRYLTEIPDSEGDPLALLIHDPALLQDAERVEAVVSAARLALENERLHADLQAQLQEVRESRARVVEAGDSARQRLERDLHDGAQQRLLALSLAIERARTLTDENDRSRLTDLLAEASSELKETLAELRHLARGIHPVLLTDEGLGPAVEALGRRAALPTRILHVPWRRFHPSVEAAAYFIVSEGLTNAARHSKASKATVLIESREGWLHVEVADDGEGGATVDAGSGLRGLQDRVVSLGGQFDVQSSTESGTRIEARIPHAHATPNRMA